MNLIVLDFNRKSLDIFLYEIYAMYEKFDQVPALTKMAEDYVIRHDRSLYRPILACIEEYCSRHDVIIGNLCYLFGANEREDYYIDIYAAFALSVAREIAIAIYNTKAPHVPLETVSVRTVIKNGEFEIRVFDRLVCRVFSLQKQQQLDFIALLGGVERPGVYSSAKLKIVPPEIQLIEIYHDLYSPAKVEQWPRLLQLAEDIWSTLDIVTATRVVVGGGKKKSYSSKELLAALGNPIIVGDLALKHYGYQKTGGRVQILTADSIEDVVKRLTKVVGRCNAVRYPLRLPLDFQATKHTIYANEQTRVPICDVYNSPAYEVVPYVKKGDARYAAEFVVMRFVLINLWLQRAIMKLGAYNEEMISVYAGAAKHMHQIISGKKPEKLFLGFDYEGVNLNPNVVKNKMRAETGNYPMYYPAINLEKQNAE